MDTDTNIDATGAANADHGWNAFCDRGRSFRARDALEKPNKHSKYWRRWCYIVRLETRYTDASGHTCPSSSSATSSTTTSSSSAAASASTASASIACTGSTTTTSSSWSHAIGTAEPEENTASTHRFPFDSTGPRIGEHRLRYDRDIIIVAPIGSRRD